jgi:transcriptional regulator with XRE-family HTH domain
MVPTQPANEQALLPNGKLWGMDEALNQTLDAVGPRLKHLRLRREVTLADLAEETGISTSTLSRLEAGLRRPTLEQLLPLARAYGVTLDELVDAPPTGNPRINLRPIACSDGSVILPLTRRPGGIQAYKFVLPTGSDNTEPDLRTHEGYDWVYVLNGILRLVLGQHDLILKPGEAAEFDTRTPHWFGATSSGPVEYLSLIGKQGERAHVRAAPKTRSGPIAGTVAGD